MIGDMDLVVDVFKEGELGMFYTLVQNNSGGYFLKDKNVDEYVIIEAENLSQFNLLADKVLENYREFCFCCGLRWEEYLVDEEDGEKEPMIYGEPVEQFKDFFSKNSKAIIYYLNGEKKIFNLSTRKYECD